MFSSLFYTTPTSLTNCGTPNGQFMLNVQFFRPFNSLSHYSTKFHSDRNRNGIDHRNELLPTTNCPKRPFSTNLQKSEQISCLPAAGKVESHPMSLDNVDEDEKDAEDMEELKKEAIWNFGPTPAASFTFAAYANDSDIIKKLVHLGVDLSRVERKYGAMPFLLKLDYETHVAPMIKFLCDIGVDSEILGWYLTKNPFIFNENLSNLQKRLEYLRLKRFTPENIHRIINANPHWLSFSVTRIDRRLGFFQSHFRLNGSQVRELTVCGPKLITTHLGRVKDVTFKVKEEMGFEKDELVKMLLAKPRIWTEKPECLWDRFDYLHNTVKFPHEAFVLCPQLLLVRESRMKHRIGFLEKVGKAQFDPTQPNYVSFQMIYEGDDAEFSTKVANSSVLEFNDYMKST